jgi:hypothetical protein
VPFFYTGWLIGIPLMDYNSPNNLGSILPELLNQTGFEHCWIDFQHVDFSPDMFHHVETQ